MRQQTFAAAPLLAVIAALSSACTDDAWFDRITSPHLKDETIIIANGEPEEVTAELWLSDPFEERSVEDDDREAEDVRWETDRPDWLALSTDRGLKVTVTPTTDWFDLRDPLSAEDPVTTLAVTYKSGEDNASREVDVRITVNIAGVWFVTCGDYTLALTLAQSREFIVSVATESVIGKLTGNHVEFRSDLGHFQGFLESRTQMRGTLVDYRGVTGSCTATLQ